MLDQCPVPEGASASDAVAATLALARAAGFATAEVRPDLAGRDRALVATAHPSELG